MATAVDIVNIGLSQIGARAQVSAISPPDGSVEAGLGARFYPIARRELLEAHSWSFAKKRAALAEVTNESSVWRYAYALPADYLKAQSVLPIALIEQYVGDLDTYLASTLEWEPALTERGSARFEIEGNVLFTHEPDAVLIYTRDVTDTNKFTPQFVTSLGMLMSSYLAGPIIKGVDGARAARAWRESAMGMAASATMSDANAGSENNDFMPASLAARA